MKSQKPVTCELSPGGIKYCSSTEGPLTLGVSGRPSRVLIDGKTTKFSHDRTDGTVTVVAPSGEGLIVIK